MSHEPTDSSKAASPATSATFATQPRPLRRRYVPFDLTPFIEAARAKQAAVEAEEKRAEQVMTLHRWLVDCQDGKTVFPAEVEVYGPSSIKHLGIDAIRGMFRELECLGYICADAVPETGAEQVAQTEWWRVTPNQRLQEGHHLADVANDVMCKVVDMLDSDGDLAARAMLLAAADLIGCRDVPLPGALDQSDALLSAVRTAMVNLAEAPVPQPEHPAPAIVPIQVPAELVETVRGWLGAFKPKSVIPPVASTHGSQSSFQADPHMPARSPAQE